MTAVASTAQVDLAALKRRHLLAEVVEGAGVELRGRGRVRQGVCPFHEEREGSFTVYGDTERWYCFGCGEGGDVLDFLQRLEGLSLPEAIRRLDAAPPTAVVSARHRRLAPAPVPSRDPALLTAAGRFYGGELQPQPGGEGLPRLPRHPPGDGCTPGPGLRVRARSAALP